MNDEIVAYLPRETLIEQAAWIRGWFEEHRAQIPRMSPHSRIPRLCEIVQSTKSVVEPKDSNYREVRHALRDVQEMRFILGTLGNELFEATYRQVFELTRGDSTVPSGDESETSGRDAQFELFIAAVLKNGGMQVRRPERGTADWWVSTPVMNWVVECKRIKNLDRLEKHVRKAASQIHSCELRGMMVLDVSLAFSPDRPSGNLDHAVPQEMLRRIRDKRDDAFVPKYLPKMAEWCNGSTVGLVVLRETLLMPAAMTPLGFRPWGAIDLWTTLNLRSPDTSARSGFDEISGLLGGALPKTKSPSE